MAGLIYYADAKGWAGKRGTAIVPSSRSLRGHTWFLQCPDVLSGMLSIRMVSRSAADRSLVLGHKLTIAELSPTQLAVPNYPGSWGRPVRTETTFLPIVDDRLAAAVASFTAKAIVEGRVNLADSPASRALPLEQEPRPWIAALMSVALHELLGDPV